MALLIGLLPAIIPVALWIIEQFLKSKGQDEASRKLMLDLAQTLREKGVKNAKSIFESSEAQIDAGNAEWDKREADAKKPEEKK